MDFNSKEDCLNLLNNLSINDFLYTKELDVSNLDNIQGFQPNLLKENLNKILNFLKTLNNDILLEYYKNNKNNLELDENNYNSFLNFFYTQAMFLINHNIDYPDLFKIYDWEDTFEGYKPTTLKDPLYPFDELKPLLELKTYLKINDEIFFNNFYQVIYDYATYSVGSCNSDLRDEFLYFYENVIVNYLNNNNNNKANKQTSIFLDYQNKLNSFSNREKLIDILENNINKEDKDLIVETNLLKKENSLLLEQIPLKYRNKEFLKSKLDETFKIIDIDFDR